MEINIGKIDITVTANGNPKALVYPQGVDYNNTLEAIEVIGENEVLYLSTRKVGEKIRVIERGKWKNVEIPTEYINALNSPSYERVKILFKRTLTGINVALNGTRPQVDLETAKVMVVDNLELFLKVQETVIKSLKDINTEFTKMVIKGLKSDNDNTVQDSWKMINDLTIKNINEINKEYIIVNDNKELKEKK